jgi:hypothetical protein
MDNIPKRVFSYYAKWTYFIAEHASSRYGIQVSGSDITVQHLVEYFAQRGSKGNLGKKLSAVHCAYISRAKLGKKLTNTHCANICKAKSGKKLTAEHCANISKAKLGKNLPAACCAKLDATFYNNVDKLKFYLEMHGHFNIARADNGPLHSFSYQVRQARSKEGEYHGKYWKYFLEKFHIEALDAI